MKRNTPSRSTPSPSGSTAAIDPAALWATIWASIGAGVFSLLRATQSHPGLVALVVVVVLAVAVVALRRPGRALGRDGSPGGSDPSGSRCAARWP